MGRAVLDFIHRESFFFWRVGGGGGDGELDQCKILGWGATRKMFFQTEESS